ncbi:Carbohydrate-binding/sugar hydrolysis domain-containing protein [Nostoc sp. DSM 114160]|jgi:parallel beta-helix repeat protein
MKYRGSYITFAKNFRLLSSSHLRYTLRVGAGLTAILVVSSGSILLSSEVNAGATHPENIAPTRTAQAPATAAAIYVNPATGADRAGAGATSAAPYKSISFALSQAQAGAVIQLAPGNYNQESGETFPLLLKPGVTLRGDEATKGQAILITGGGFYTSRTFARQDITILAEQDTTIAGVTVTNPNSRGTAVWVESTNPTIKNSTFTNSVREGVFVTGTGNPKIESNLFVQNKGNGISIAKAAQGEIRSNLFQDTGFGLAIGGTSTPLVVENQIIENQDGLFISESAKPVLRKNVIQNNKRDGVVATVNASPDPWHQRKSWWQSYSQ